MLLLSKGKSIKRKLIMKILHVKLSIILLLLTVVISSCAKAPEVETGPAVTVKKFHAAISTGNIEGAQKFLAEGVNLRNLYEPEKLTTDYPADAILDNTTYDIVSEEGDVAVVRMTMDLAEILRAGTGIETGQIPQGCVNIYEFRLQKINGKWLITGKR